MSTDPIIRKRRIRAFRDAAGISQLELGQRAGVSQPVISAMERGMSAPLLLERVAQALEFTGDPERLLDFVDFVPRG